MTGIPIPREIEMSKVFVQPAFPVPNLQDDEDFNGLSKREYFAAKAMQGFCANPAVFAPNDMHGWGLVNCNDELLADYCVGLADALVASLAK
jgi:hypothetical protein